MAIVHSVKRSAKDERGFTLVEMLIAASIMATIFSIIFGVFFNVLQGKERAERMGENYQTARIILSLMENDLRSAILFSNNRKAAFVGGDREEGGASMDEVRFTSLSSYSFGFGKKVSGQRVIEYVPEYNPETKKVRLYRNETPTLNGEETDDEKRIDLGVGVYGLNLRYHSKGVWKDSWEAKRGGRLPEAVEIEIAIKDETGEVITFTEIVQIEAG